MEKTYNKLVRDKIPEIIDGNNKKCTVDYLKEDEHLRYLYLKLNEEVSEFQENHDLEELADILEVIDGILELRGISLDKINEIKTEKKLNRGGFSKGILLKSVTETK